MRAGLRLVALGAWLVAAVPAAAETVGATLSISATVVGRCSVSAGTLAFGTYAAGSNGSQSGAVTVNCTQGTGYAVALDDGASGGRRMNGPDGSALPYEIYADEAHSRRWGRGAGAVEGTGSGSDQTLRLYAAISPAYPSPGTYSDTVTVSVIY